MNSSVCFLMILLGAFALATAEDSTNSSVQVVDNVTDLQRDNPEASFIKLDSRRGPRGRYYYNFGARKPGDSLLGTYRNSVSFEKPQDKKLSFKYVSLDGEEAVVTYISVVVEQTSDWGAAYVLRGGIGKTSVTVQVEAHNTTKLSYEGEVYGQ